MVTIKMNTEENHIESKYLKAIIIFQTLSLVTQNHDLSY